MKNIRKKLYSFAISISIFSATEGMEAEQIHAEVNRVLEQFHRNMEEYYERTRVKKGTIISVKQEAVQNEIKQPRNREVEKQEVSVKSQIERLKNDMRKTESFIRGLQEKDDEVTAKRPSGTNLIKPYDRELDRSIGKLLEEMQSYYQSQITMKSDVEQYQFLVWNPMWWCNMRLYKMLMEKVEKRLVGIGEDITNIGFADTHWQGRPTEGQFSNEWVLEALRNLQKKQEEVMKGINEGTYQPCKFGRLMYVGKS